MPAEMCHAQYGINRNYVCKISVRNLREKSRKLAGNLIECRLRKDEGVEVAKLTRYEDFLSALRRD